MINMQVSGFTSMAPVVAAIELPPSDMRDIGLGVRKRMQDNIDNGRDHKGRKFKPYGASTSAKKSKRGKSQTVNLQDTGNMRRQLTVSSDPKGVRILLQGDRRAVGLHHQYGVGVPRREWFGYTDSSADKARAQYARLVGRRVDQA